MASILETFDIHSPQTGKLVAIDLADGLDGSHIDFMETEWTSALDREYSLALFEYFQLPEEERNDSRYNDILGARMLQDHHWKWREKCSSAEGTNRRVLSLLNGSAVEAAMVLRYGDVSREPPGVVPILYVDFVAVAPWNRQAIQTPQRFRGLGTVMLGAAVEISQLEGFDGRCGLHSLPQSEGFYHRIGMRDLGPDLAYSSLRYFEFDAAGAANFRS